jgi:hypothetical protein
LGGEAFPVFYENLGAVGVCDFYGAVGGMRVDHDDFALAVGDQRLNAGERAREIGFFVVGDEDDGEEHGLRITRVSFEWNDIPG